VRERERKGSFLPFLLPFEKKTLTLTPPLSLFSSLPLSLHPSGKSTVGKLVGAALRYQLFDTDQLIEAAASAETGTPTTVAEIFAAEGEEAFREAETATLQALLPYTSVVVATGGGAVTKRANWGLMQHGIVCWLDGPAPLLASRAAKDGIAKRPLLQQQQGEEANTSGENSEDELTARLSSLLEKRKAQYANADLRIPLVSATETSSSASSASPALVTFRLLRALEKRIDGDAAAREEERKFEITGTTDVPKTMRVVPAKGGGNGGGGGGGGGESGKGKGGKGFGRKSKDGGGAPAA
jgi:shikimate kinase